MYTGGPISSIQFSSPNRVLVADNLGRSGSLDSTQYSSPTRGTDGERSACG